MKKALGVFLFFALCFAVFAPWQVAASAQGVLLQNSNIRNSPGVQPGNIIRVLPIGTQVQVLVQGQGWDLISKDYTLVGWIASWLVHAQEPVSSTTMPANTAAPQTGPSSTALLDLEPAKTYGTVQLNSNLRTGPMQAIIEVVPQGSRVEILFENNNWYQVRTHEGATGWIAGWLVAPSKNATQVQVAHTADVAKTVSPQQVGIVPAAIDTQELNKYWLSKVNQLRGEAGLRVLQVSDTLAATAATWADYMGKTEQLTHNRTDGSSMHEWAEAQGIPFAERYAPNGWDTNYFTENIGRHLVAATMDEAKMGLDRILASFVTENNGPHFRTVYHKDWNSVGSGFYFDPVGGGKYQMYAAFHYASLKTK